MTPDKWILTKLNELGFVGRGRSRNRPRNDPSLYNGPYPFFQTANIKAANLYLREYTQTYNEKGLAQSKLWKPGTLCITIAANIAETAILAIEGCFPDSVVGFVADLQKCDVRFIKYYIDTIKLHMQSISRGTTQDNLSLEKLLSFEILTPPLPTQRKIAAILSTYDDLIENNTRRIHILEEMARAIYREWFVKFRFPGWEGVRRVETEVGVAPEGWEVVTISDAFDTLGGGTPSTKVDEYWVGGDVIWFTPSDLTKSGTMFIADSEKKITEIGLQKSSAKLFPVYSVMMTSRATIGATALNTKPACTNQGFITCIPNERVSAYQIYFWIQENLEKIISVASGATYKEISRGEFREFPFLLAETSVSQLFVSVVEPIGRQIENLISKNKILCQTRDLLLPRLVSGEVEVSEVEVRGVG